MLVRKQIEVSRARILAELCVPVLESREALRRRIAESWSAPSVVALSVRSGFDLFLSERAWPAGSEVIMSGANVPDMALIVEHHELRVRAVDFDLQDLTPSIQGFAAAITERTRAIVFAQLFGSRVDLAPLARLAREHRIDLIEDAAQAFDVSYRGHPAAILSMFSFGPIKSITALGGAVLTVRDDALAERLRARLRAQPIASAMASRRRLVKYLLLTTAARPRLLSLISRYLTRRGRDMDEFLSGSARSFAGRDLIFAIRERPSRPLLRLLARRLSSIPIGELESRARQGRELTVRLADRVEVPRIEGIAHTHWVFPILCDNPAELVAVLRAEGFDATRRATLAPVSADLPRLKRAFERIVYLPFSTDHTAADRDRLVRLVRDHARTRAIPGSYKCVV